jgi:aminopeptidase
LEESILKTVRVDNKTNPISNQAKHENNIEKHKNILNKYDFKSLLFKNSKGTNLKIDLPNNHI